MSRNPRAGACPGPGLTRTEQLRQARTAALLKDTEKKEARIRQQEDFKVRRKYVRPEAKKVDFKKPGMTKAMLARVKQAEKFKQEYERKEEALTSGRLPKRTPAPIGGDARSRQQLNLMGRGRTMGRRTPAASPTRAPQFSGRAGPSVIPPRRGVTRAAPRATDDSISRKTAELAKVMDAEVIQADPIGEGPISNVVIPAGTVSGDRTAIVSIVQPSEAKAASQMANRSIQVISESLDEQDATECAAVQGRLSELQQARREFVIAVANVGGNVVQLDDVTPPLYSYRIPDVEDEYVQPKYGRDHPDIVATREYMQKAKEDMEVREAARRMEEEFERIAFADDSPEGLQLDIPFEEEMYQDRDISWEEDESGIAMPHPSKIKAYIPPIPKQQQPYQHVSFDPEELEKFFDVKRYPPCPRCGPPPGRENLNPDLWDFEDIWYKPPPQPEGPDLIEFEQDDLIQFEEDDLIQFD
ncbi:PREDICTED: uncharacterized protein LOC108580155 [Habropoda laboriosa]|uniref:uncharacterized protein LOC108580155 n=1 Tax=Habropoda laboriosa TaxID=597456 RepID=UPI00083E1A6B|nr:PREDICTED: uncharacterized protein LOC108580155 [Habropoda laboriosa]